MYRTVSEYVDYLMSKGFVFGDDANGFIEFGQNYTDTRDEVVIIAIELTLKIQKEFDGSFFISLLEKFKSEEITNRKEALLLMESLQLI